MDLKELERLIIDNYLHNDVPYFKEYSFSVYYGLPQLLRKKVEMEARVINKQAYHTQVQKFQNEVIQSIPSTIESKSNLEEWEIPAVVGEIYLSCKKRLEEKIAQAFPDNGYKRLTHFTLNAFERRFFQEEAAKVKTSLKGRCSLY